MQIEIPGQAGNDGKYEFICFSFGLLVSLHKKQDGRGIGR